VSVTARRLGLWLGLDNTPGPVARANLRRAVGWVANSRHLLGLAADLAVPAADRRPLIAWTKARNVNVLEYGGHIHLALVGR
jgi:hypothetical protein